MSCLREEKSYHFYVRYFRTSLENTSFPLSAKNKMNCKDNVIDKLPIPAYNIFREEVLIMKYLSVAQIAEKWGLSERTVRNYCAQGRVPDAFLTGKTWNIPDTAEKPDRIPKVRKAPTTLLEYLRREQESKLSGGIYHKVQIDLPIIPTTSKAAV